MNWHLYCLLIHVFTPHNSFIYYNRINFKRSSINYLFYLYPDPQRLVVVHVLYNLYLFTNNTTLFIIFILFGNGAITDNYCLRNQMFCIDKN